MKIEIIKISNNWQDVKNLAMNTVGKDSGKLPTSSWKKKIILAEHSPIRSLVFTIRFTDIPYYIVMHLVRHKIGVEHYVSTQRTDRTGVNRNKLPQDNLISYTMVADAQALITISRKRLCNCADPETKKTWQLVKDEVAKYEPELASCMVSECIYRGFCPEMKSCGFSSTEKYVNDLIRYRNIEKYVNGAIEKGTEHIEKGLSVEHTLN